MPTPKPIKRTSTSLPFTVHFAEVRNSFQSKGPYISIRGDKQIGKDPDVPVESIASLRIALELLIEAADRYDYVVTFAMGGMAPLLYITERLSEAIQTGSADTIASIKSKYHLFAGLNWKNRAYSSERRFKEWLNGLPHGSRLLIFDTGNFGTGAFRAFKMLERYAKKKNPGGLAECCVVGIVTEFKTNQQNIDRRVGQSRTRLIRGFIHVDAVPFEDALHLVGYRGLRSKGLIQPVKAAHSLRLIYPDGQMKGIGAAFVAGTFQALLREGSLADRVMLKGEVAPPEAEVIDLAKDLDEMYPGM